ncbi:hypothetical protein GCM10007973_13550 [Polymorphobacter multimanifer]|uniref:Tetratricopeptide repeat protein n=1 Tax=Polymorphobacter multimanifer TaxID=1070431 RepID=A0A841L400_9SPHN|nr:hypothetical protein [Polymorphobacter multimanifer]MBB6227006.1 hypothetical protein [Polymorphobacter multimanifer]GGI78102.1 hypothetical protein GCM10007973_13550 [Polymorphobacter multimanifer]
MRILAPSLALALLLATAPLAAQPLDIGEPVQAAIQQGLVLMNENREAEALAGLDAALARTSLPAERGRIEQLRGFLLARLNRLEEARTAIEFAVSTDPAPNVAVLSTLFKLQLFTDKHVPAAETLVLLAATDPKALELVTPEMVYRLRTNLGQDPSRVFDLDLTLINAGWLQGTASEGTVDGLIEGAIPGLLAQQRTEEATALLARIQKASALLTMAIDRRFTPLWPAIEARLGPGARTASNAEVARTKARFDADPADGAARLAYASALNNAAREADALVVAAGAAPDPAALDALPEEDLWLVDLEARLLGHLGRDDEALARYESLARSRMEGRGGLIAQIINWGLFAVELDRPQAALTAADFADTKAEAASPYGRLFIAMTRSCALAQLGRTADAEAAAAPLLAGEKPANPEALLGALICLGRNDAAAALVVAQLKDPGRAPAMLWKLQPLLIEDREGAIDKRHRAGLRTLKARPDVRAAFTAMGRDLPPAVSPPR